MSKPQRRAKLEHDWSPYRLAERPVGTFKKFAEHRLALAYANTYEVGMSSLGYQRVYQLVHATENWLAERFFTNGHGMPRSVENDRALADFGAIAFSVSFEEDYVNLLQMLDRARIPLRRKDRQPWDPLVVMGGSCASINPLPMAEFVDVFCLGAGENVLQALLDALAEEQDREQVFDRLAATPGFYVPARYDASQHDSAFCDHTGEPGGGLAKLAKLELTDSQMRQPGHLPTSCIITPHTEFSEKFLVEMSRGCPEKCKYCWATFGMGKFRWHPTDYILEALERARPITRQVGFLATAVGDHPEIGRILNQAWTMGFRSSVSSIRIPAVKEETLVPLYLSGARSITLAPETGSDRLRFVMNKPIPNAVLLEKVRLIFRHGFSHLKLYFILGMPTETLEDVQAILDLGAACRDIMREESKGHLGEILLGCNLLIPKPYTPWQREAFEDEKSLEAKIALLKRGVARMPNLRLSMMPIRQAIWQTYISRAGQDAADAIERVARGGAVAAVLREYAERIHPEVFQTFPGDLRWHFLRMGAA